MAGDSRRSGEVGEGHARWQAETRCRPCRHRCCRGSSKPLLPPPAPPSLLMPLPPSPPLPPASSPPADYPPTVFLSMVKDTEQAERIGKNRAILRRRGSPVEVVDVWERQVYPSYFSDRGTYISEGGRGGVMWKGGGRGGEGSTCRKRGRFCCAGEGEGGSVCLVTPQGVASGQGEESSCSAAPAAPHVPHLCPSACWPHSPMLAGCHVVQTSAAGLWRG